MSNSGGSSSAPSMGVIVIILIVICALAGYAYWRNSKDPNWNPYDSLQFKSTQKPIPLPVQ